MLRLLLQHYAMLFGVFEVAQDTHLNVPDEGAEVLAWELVRVAVS
jgi:hypothetical protein